MVGLSLLNRLGSLRPTGRDRNAVPPRPAVLRLRPLLCYPCDSLPPKDLRVHNLERLQLPRLARPLAAVLCAAMCPLGSNLMVAHHRRSVFPRTTVAEAAGAT